jgi:hypothetical protein
MTFLLGQIGVIYNLCHFFKYINSFTFYTISDNNIIGIHLQHTFFFIFFSQCSLSFSVFMRTSSLLPFYVPSSSQFPKFISTVLYFFLPFPSDLLSWPQQNSYIRRFIHATSNEDYFANPRKMAGAFFTKWRANKL